MDFTSYFWFLVTGRQPNEDQAFFANAILCALAEHGLVPSVVAARMTYAAAPEALQGAVAAGLLGCGSVVLGSAEVAGKFYAECVADQRATGDDLHAVAVRNIERLRQTTKAIPGFGHPQHAGGDPRANLLLDLADQRGVAGEHVAMMRALKAALPETIGRDLPVNVNGRDPGDPARPRLAACRAQGHRPAVPHRGADRPPDRGGGAADRVHPVGRGRGGDRVRW